MADVRLVPLCVNCIVFLQFNTAQPTIRTGNVEFIVVFYTGYNTVNNFNVDTIFTKYNK